MTFALYETDSNFATADSQPIQTFTTDEKGEFVVDEDENGDGALAQGYYVLVETDAPDDYIVKETPIQIVVNNDGVFVNAGTADDNVKVESGLGTLVATMRSFAVDDDVDTTLHDVKAQSQTGEYNEADGTITWTTDNPATELHLQYDDAHSTDLTYIATPGVAGNAATYTADEGWTRLNITQCADLHTDHTDANKQDLGDQSLNALFTGETVIHVTNSKPEPTPSTPEPPDEETPAPTPTPQNTPAPEPTPVPEQTPVPEPTPAPVAAQAAPAVTIPQTSDDMPLGALTAAAAAAAAAFAALLVVRKRRHGKH